MGRDERAAIIRVRVLSAVGAGYRSIPEIARHSRLPPCIVAGALLSLELDDRVGSYVFRGDERFYLVR